MPRLWKALRIPDRNAQCEHIYRKVRRLPVMDDHLILGYASAGEKKSPDVWNVTRRWFFRPNQLIDLIVFLVHSDQLASRGTLVLLNSGRARNYPRIGGKQ
jgi:hypothetical protein